MARKTANWTATEGRDAGKLFTITEMSAEQAESWGMRVLLALMENNVDMPEGFESLGMAGLAEVGLKAIGKLKWEVAQPLMKEMFDCVTIIPDPRKTHISRPLVEDDIEEVATRLSLRMEVFNLHVDFSKAAVSSILGRVQGTAASKGRVTRTSVR